MPLLHICTAFDIRIDRRPKGPKLIQLYDAAGRGIPCPFRSICTPDDVNEVTDDHQQTLLHAAIRGKNRGNINSLIDLGADLRMRDRDGVSPLFLGFTSGDRELAERFLAETRDNSDELKRALTLAVKCDHAEVSQMLLEQHPSEATGDLLELVGQSGSIKCFEMLRNRGIDFEDPKIFERVLN
jgi:ankyrin repeat protein